VVVPFPVAPFLFQLCLWPIRTSSVSVSVSLSLSRARARARNADMSATGVAWQRAVAMSSDAVAEARKGRLKQRYDNEFRLVAGSAPPPPLASSSISLVLDWSCMSCR
jgi:hypothetical protein